MNHVSGLGVQAANQTLGQMLWDWDAAPPPATDAEALACLSPGNSAHPWTVTARTYGGFGRERPQTAAAGYDFHNVGVLATFDRSLGDDIRFGALLGGSMQRGSLDQNLGRASDDIFRFGLYGGFHGQAHGMGRELVQPGHV
jgi:uncharacterized protein with beta-barrel porin domain